MSQTNQESPKQETPAVSRRNFLSSSAAAGGLAIAAPSIIKAQSSSDEVNVGIIGIGEQGRVQIDATLPIPNVKFRAVCDIWSYSQRYGERYLARSGHEVNVYENYQEMLEKEKDLDAILIATPDFMHAPMTADALSAGKHVYCEKLMSNTIEGARKMVKASQDTGNLLQIGHQRRSNPRYLHAKEKLFNPKSKGGAHIFGKLTTANGQWNRAVSEDRTWPTKYVIDDATLKNYGYKNMHEFRNWRWFKSLGGGPICDLGAHQIDIFNWLLDAKPKTVQASGGVDYYDTHEWHDNVMAIYEFDTPEGVVRAFYQVLTTTSAGGGFFEYFMGDEGCMKISEIPRLTKIYREARAPEWDGWLERNFIKQSAGAKKASSEEVKVDVRESAALVEYLLPVELKDKKIHQPHLENFFEAVRMFGGDKAKAKAHLNCPGETAFETAVTVLRVNEAIEARKTLDFAAGDFKA
jgi:predicted dehydrogenase